MQRTRSNRRKNNFFCQLPFYGAITNIIFIFRAAGGKNLDLEAVKWKTVAKVGVALLRPPCLQMRNISAGPCPKSLRFLAFDSESADEPVLHKKPHTTLRKTVAQLLGRTAKSQLREMGTTAKYLVEMFPSPT